MSVRSPVSPAAAAAYNPSGAQIREKGRGTRRSPMVNAYPLAEYHSSPGTNHIPMEIAFRRSSPCTICTWFPLTYGILVGGMHMP